MSSRGKFASVLSQSASWLLDEHRESPPAVHRVLSRWSAQPQCVKAVERAVGDMIRAVEADGPDCATRLRLADGLLRDGLILPPTAAARLLVPACRALLRATAASNAMILVVGAVAWPQIGRAHV